MFAKVLRSRKNLYFLIAVTITMPAIVLILHSVFLNTPTSSYDYGVPMIQRTDIAKDAFHTKSSTGKTFKL